MYICSAVTAPLKFVSEVGKILSESTGTTRGFLKSTRAMTDIVIPWFSAQSTVKLKWIGAKIGFADDSMKFFQTAGSWRKIWDFSKLTWKERFIAVSDLYYSASVTAKIGSKHFELFELSKSTAFSFTVTTLFFDIVLAGVQAKESLAKLYQYHRKGTWQWNDLTDHVNKWKASGSGVVQEKHRTKYENLGDSEIRAKLLEKWTIRRSNFFKKGFNHLLNVAFQITITAMYILRAGPEVFGFSRQSAADISNVIVAALGYAMLGIKAWVNMNPVSERRFHNIGDGRTGIFTWDKEPVK